MLREKLKMRTRVKGREERAKNWKILRKSQIEGSLRKLPDMSVVENDGDDDAVDRIRTLVFPHIWAFKRIPRDRIQ